MGFGSLPGTQTGDNNPIGSTHVGRREVVFQVSGGDAKKWGMALKNVRTLPDGVGPEGAVPSAITHPLSEE
jgi:hypothetical protein